MISDEQRKQLVQWFRSSDLKAEDSKADKLTEAALRFTKEIMELCPQGREQDDALAAARESWHVAIEAYHRSKTL